MQQQRLNNFRTLLRFWSDLAAAHGLRYSIWFGTLLGYIREGRLISYDGDVDVLIDASSTAALLALARMPWCTFNSELAGLRPWREGELRLLLNRDIAFSGVGEERRRFDCQGYRVDRQIDACAFNGPIARLVLMRNGLFTHLDVDLYASDAAPLAPDSYYPALAQAESLPPLHSCHLEGISLYCPVDSHPILLREYGPDYMIPAYHYREGRWCAPVSGQPLSRETAVAEPFGLIWSCERWVLTEQILRDIDLTLGNTGIRWVITGATFLGAIRHGGPIPWDERLELGIFANQIADFERLEPAFEVLGYRFARDGVDLRLEVQGSVQANVEGGIPSVLFQVLGDCSGDMRRSYASDVLPLQLYRFGDLNLPGPLEDTQLQAEYGKQYLSNCTGLLTSDTVGESRPCEEIAASGYFVSVPDMDYVRHRSVASHGAIELRHGEMYRYWISTGGETWPADATARQVWGLADGTRTVSDIVQLIAQAQGIPPVQAVTNVFASVRGLCVRGMLSLS